MLVCCIFTIIIQSSDLFHQALCPLFHQRTCIRAILFTSGHVSWYEFFYRLLKRICHALSTTPHLNQKPPAYLSVALVQVPICLSRIPIHLIYTGRPYGKINVVIIRCRIVIHNIPSVNLSGRKAARQSYFQDFFSQGTPSPLLKSLQALFNITKFALGIKLKSYSPL